MNRLRGFRIALRFSASIALGFCLRGWYDDVFRGSVREATARYAQSFSEVENAKARLRDLFNEFMDELSDQHLFPAFNAEVLESEHISCAIKELESAVSAFKGTEQEIWVVHELLCILKLNKAHQAWMDLYLKLLYDHPTHEKVGILSAQAIVVARKTGREAELYRGFDHLIQIPFNFEAKELIKRAVAQSVDVSCSSTRATQSRN